jgi:transposase
LEEALVGYLRPHRRFLLAEHLSHIDYLDEAIASFTEEIAQRLSTEEEAIQLLDTIPGLSPRSARIRLAEIGTDLTRFPSAWPLASWAGECPGNPESADKRKSGKTRKGSRWPRQVLIEAAHGVAHTKQTYLAALYRRLAARCGAKKALVAVGPAIRVRVYHVLTRQVPYEDLGPNYFGERDRQAVERRSVRRLKGLG